jgi:acetylornithine deacetylase/succinyl-diaminopimelate desuccinylase-like protein
MKFYCLFVFVLISTLVQSQISTEIAIVKNYNDKQRLTMLKEYMEFVSIPNTMNDREDLMKNADFVMNLMRKSGINNVKLLNAKTAGSIPSVYGEVLKPGAKKTIIFYAHYDGQPVNFSKWAEGLSPFKPQLTNTSLDKGGKFIEMPKRAEDFTSDETRLYSRAAADDKAGVYAIIKAYEAIQKNMLTPNINIKFFFEGEEERGSTHLNEILEANQELLKSDLWLICDGPIHISGRKTIMYGVRGDVNLNLTVYGPSRPLHSGNYGNWAPNPANKLVKLLASMKDDKGYVAVKGFYDDVIPLSPQEKQALAAIPDPADQMQKELLFAIPEIKDKSFLECIATIPTLNINGIVSANVGKLASNIIPTSASATLDLRLVKGNDVERQVNKVINHIKSQGYFVTENEPTPEEKMKHPNICYIYKGSGYNAQRTSMDLPIAKEVANAIMKSTTDPLIQSPSAGGSLPLFLFEKILKTPPITIPIVNYDNNQHGENENLRLGNLFNGMDTMAAIMLMK